MSDRENLIAEIKTKAEKEAKKQKLNEAQAKLYIDEEIKKALEEFDKTQENNGQENKIPVVQPTVETPKTQNKIENKTEKVKKNTEPKKIKYIVHTPVKNYCGEVAGVQFAYGKAEVKPGWILNWFIEHGYKVEEVSE